MINNILLSTIFCLSQVFNLVPSGLENIFNNPSSFKNGSVSGSQEEGTLYPENITGSLGLKLEARSALILDRKSGKVLFEKAGEEKMPMASLTKIMTTLVALENNINLDDPIIINNNFSELEGADVNLNQGEELKVQDLLYGSLVASGNDAASALAFYVSGDLDNFVIQMNKKASDLKLSNTHFSNVSGLDAEGHYSTAFDLAKLTNEAFNSPKFLEATTTKRYEIIPKEGKSRPFNNTNKLLLADYPKVKAGKTGYTEEAGFCFIALSEDEKGNQIITVILGEKLNGEQFQETKALVDWAFKTYKWRK